MCCKTLAEYKIDVGPCKYIILYCTIRYFSISAAIAIVQLSSLVQDLEASIAGLNNVLYTKDELSILDILGTKLADISTTIQKKTGLFRPSCSGQA
jgi:hypothetical protein